MIDNKSNLKEKLKDELKELFQFESKDLDFGIYRIMNYKRKEIENFIEKELIEEINNQLESVSSEEKKNIEEQFKEIKQRIKDSFGTGALENGNIKDNFKNTPLYEEYYEIKKQLEEVKISEGLEKEIYNHLINFFSRYYDNGDFINKRRYSKKEKYVIPYNGEEVALYWANKDQYYIKTTEYFRRYTFIIKGLIVNFRVVEVEEDNGNIKSLEKKFFVLNKEIFNYNKDNEELDIYFEYRGLTEEEMDKFKEGKTVYQDTINEEIINILQKKIPDHLVKKIFEKDGNKTSIEKNIYAYTRRNTTNYFIHKDLKGFLERELDFYIKNDFLNLDDLQILDDERYFDKLRLYMIEVRAFRHIALKVIEFLAQLEEFQKKIWEKKKFVINTHYVITLDKIEKYAGEKFLESILENILSNKRQLEEWKKLFGSKINHSDELISNNTLEGKEWKKLPIDTKYFNDEFKWKLLVALSEKNDLDGIVDGILIKSENFQALNLLLNKYEGKAQTIYIDPPYNTGSDGFLYKDKYQSSSWISMIENRLDLSKKLMKDDSTIFTSIGDTLKSKITTNSSSKLQMLLNQIFGEKNFIATFIRKSGVSPKQDSKYIANSQDYVLLYGKNSDNVKLNKKEANNLRLQYTDEYFEKRGHFDINQLDRGSIKYSESYDYPIIMEKGEIAEVINGNTYQKITLPERIEIWPGGDKNDKKWSFRWSKDKFKWGIENGFIVFRKGKDNSWKVFYKEYELVDNKDNPRNRENPYDSLILKFTNEAGSGEISNLFGSRIFEYPKPSELIKYLVGMSTGHSDYIIDFFSGSGTTAQAVMELNKEDSGSRKFILVEMEDYFYNIIIPRIKKVAYSINWKDGKPQNMNGLGVLFKYHILEQYEDALENIEFEEPQKTLYNLSDYFVKYMLDWETKNSNTFLNLNRLKDPFNYELKIMESYQPKNVNVDVVETFNYLLGCNISRYQVLEDINRKYIFVFGARKGKRLTIVWRSLKDIDLSRDKEVINNQLKDFNPDEIYINGDALVNGFKAIEPLFKTLMFEQVE